MKTLLQQFLFSLLVWVSIPMWGTPAVSQFKVRAFHLDCRTQVMTVSAIKELAYDLSQKGINTLIIEYEATFPFREHATLCNEHAFSRKDIQEIVNYCTSLAIDVIPLQNCFGHCEYILRHDRYLQLREDGKEVSQVCPLKIEEATKVFREIFREVAELHPSPYFHIGADETYLLGSCPQCSKVDKSRLFVDYIKAMCNLVKEMGKQPVIWADIILKYPEAIQELPKDIIFVDWNYGWAPDNFGKLDNLLNLGAKIWGAGSMRSYPDNIYLTQWMKHFNNLATFIPFARKHGYEGMIDTSWSTSGTYGFHFSNEWEIISMQPVRQVYPMSGFQILIDAFCQAVNSEKTINPEEFIKSYAQERYGLTAEEVPVFLDYFLLPQETVRQGEDAKGQPITQVLQECENLKSNFSRLSPKMHKEEFKHYRLMLDLRINYLQYKKLEFDYESATYDSSQAETVLKNLKTIISESEKLNIRFIELNKDYLKPGQTTDINILRNEKMNELYRVLQKQCSHL